MTGGDPEVEFRRLISTMSLDQQRVLLGKLLIAGDVGRRFDASRPEQPTLLSVPRRVRGFQIRVDLLHVKPPVWRRLVLPGDLTLDRVHVVVNQALGWTDSHLHRFRTGNGRNASYFLSRFDVSEGQTGILEDGVRLDQVIGGVGDKFWYDYDFGDGWEHTIRVEAVLPAPPVEVEVVTGRRACPPEDVGGVWGYESVASWVESDYDKSLLPDQFDSASDAIEWLASGWHPAIFDLEECRVAVRDALTWEA